MHKKFKVKPTKTPRPAMKKLALLATTILLVAALAVNIASAAPSVAVKGGDWIEYKVTAIGNPTPIHNITWARLDVKSVEGSTINTDIQTMLGNGTLWLEPKTNFNVATGLIGEGAIIPTNLSVGDVYFSQYEGNITVTGTHTIEAAGMQRTVLTGEAHNTSYYWDKQTGIMVKATTLLDDCKIFSEVKATNLWQPQIVGLAPEILYMLIAGLVAVASIFVALVLLIVWRRRAK